MPDFAVVGDGAVGVAISFLITKLGYSCALVGRSGSLAQNAKITKNGAPFALDIPAYSAEDLRSVKQVFFAVKAYDLALAIDGQVDQFSKSTVICPVGNGAVETILGTAKARHPHFNWRLGSTTFGVKKTGDGEFVISDKGQVLWGSPLGDEMVKIEKDLAGKDGPFVWTKDILGVCRKKWLFNTVINTLAASKWLTTNGELLEHTEELVLILNEAFALGEELWGPWSAGKMELSKEMLGLIADTAENENSMVRDLRLGRPTESNFLAGLAFGKDKYPNLNRLHEKILRHGER